MPAKPGEKKHGSEVWIGYDFDGTLAYSEPGSDLQTVGEPVQPMLDRLKMHLQAGWKVKIFTARVSFLEPTFLRKQIFMIEEWCQKHVGRILEITCVKDFACEVVYDDRAVSVGRNTGRFLRLNTLGDPPPVREPRR